jgi:hypothetical protein
MPSPFPNLFIYSLQDGGEWNNVFRRNLGARTKPLPPDTPVVGENDDFPATFWITNPSQHYVGNVAAGSQSTGFWMDLKIRGPSAFLEVNANIKTRNTPLGSFRENVSHSNRVHGITAYPTGYAPGVQTFFEDSLSYKNQLGAGIFFHGTSRLGVQGGFLADNRQAMRNFGAGQSIVDSVTVIGRSDHMKRLISEVGRLPWTGCNTLGVSFQPNQGFGNSLVVTNTTFSGFADNVECDAKSFALYVENDQVRHGIFNADVWFEGNSFDSLTNRISACSSIHTSHDTKSIGEQVVNIAFEEPDGSLSPTGEPGFFVQQDQPALTTFFDTSDCVNVDDYATNTCLMFCPRACLRLAVVVASAAMTTQGMEMVITETSSSSTTAAGAEESTRRGQWRRDFNEITNAFRNSLYGVALPFDKTFDLSFRQQNDASITWPHYAYTTFGREPVCATLNDATTADPASMLTLVKPTEEGNPARCEELFSGDDLPSGMTGFQHWHSNLHIVDGDYVKTTKRVTTNGGVQRLVDASCLKEFGGRSYKISGQIRMQDGSGADVACMTHPQCPTMEFQVDGQRVKTHVLATKDDGTWSAFEFNVTLPADMNSKEKGK